MTGPIRSVAGATLALLAATASCRAPEAEGPKASPPEAPAVERVEPDFVLTADHTHNRFHRDVPPALRVPSGALVEVHTKEATDGQLTPTSTEADLETLSFDPIHPLTGPIYVEGAEPGDTLAVRLVEIEVGEWGFTAIVPGFGFLAEEIPGPYLKTFRFEPGATEAVFRDDIRIPLRPFPGVLGVAPDTEERLSTIPPRANGGNMDNRHLVAGTTVYFPVFVEGALLSVGDTHAAQGDGEVGGTGIEAPMRIVLEPRVVKGGRRIAEPEYETEDAYAVTAFATDLDEAAKKATRYMIDYLVAEHDLTREEAYALCSIAADLKISEVVDMPHVLVSMHIPKTIFRR